MDPNLFNSILNYFRTGNLAIPEGITNDSLSTEVKYLMLDELTHLLEPPITTIANKLFSFITWWLYPSALFNYQ